MGDVTRIMTRSLYAVVNTKVSWNSTVELSKEAYAEFVFCNQNVDSLNCRSPPLLPCIQDKFVYSDASDHACVDPSFKMKAEFLTKIGHLLKGRKVQPGGSLRL